jgi:hypothetical protein
VSVQRARSRRRRRPLGRLLAALAGAVVVFGIGVAVGEALHDNPSPSGDQTVVRTIEPLQVAPAAISTVTVTNP